MKLKILFEQLENNFEAEQKLIERFETICTMPYYKMFGKLNEQINDLDWNMQIKKRVLRLRYRILENIAIETNKEMFYASKAMSNINLKKVS